MKAIMNKCTKKTMALLICAACMTISLFGLLSLSASGANTLTGHGVAGLTATYEDDSHQTLSGSDLTQWTASADNIRWEATTKRTGGFFSGYSYFYKGATLTLTNDSGSEKVLAFTYTVALNGGEVSIDGGNVSDTNSGKFSKTLAAGESVIVKAKTSGNARNTTSVSLTGISLSVNNITVTFVPAEKGSYTVDGSKISATTQLTDVSTKKYTLVATANARCHFAGWYIGGVLQSTSQSWTTSFAESCTVSAMFITDPLYSATIVPSESPYSKEELVEINSRYYHDSSTKKVEQGSIPTNQSAYSITSASGIKDKIDAQFVPSLHWSETSSSTDSISVYYSAKATGDVTTGILERSTAYVRMHTDIIRVYAQKNCNISFDYVNAMTVPSSLVSTNCQATVTLYYYVSTSANATIAQVKTGEKLTETSGSSGEITLSEGSYLYILMEGYGKAEATATPAGFQFEYEATISSFEVSYNEVTHQLSAGFQDNTGKHLTSGKININNTAYSIGTNGCIADQTLADGTEVKLQVGAVPTGYVHIGWTIKDSNGVVYHYVSTYAHQLTSSCEIYAIFVPKMTITMGANGYEDAAYVLFNGSAHNGEYVARNASATEFYATLSEAFEETDIVVLLAGDTINGDWTIPANKTLVIPYGLVDSASTTPIATTSRIAAAYCQVTINGKVLVDGSLLVSSQQYQSTGTPGGPIGHLVLGADATVVVNGVLYSFGPVTGSGRIIANDGAIVHELVEIADNRGPLGMYNIYEARGKRKVFPVTAMHFKNIESVVTYHKGAQLIGHAALTYDTVSQAPFNIIGSGGTALLNITSGTMTKYYDSAAGQFVFRSDEGAEVETGDFTIELTATVSTQTVDITLNSADYYLPLNSCFRFEVAGELTVNGNYKFLPGATLKVLDSGTVIVADTANLVFYRMNDYDNRGRHNNSTEQWGFSATAYPSNPTRVPGVTYSFSFTASNVGSAKLIVDGKLIVQGGLYVTNQLQTEDAESGLVIREDGYNFLTGYGTIDMTGANSNITTISEAMSASGTNDIDWATVAVVSMKGLKADADADEPEQYSSLSGVVGGVLNSNNLNVWLADAPELNVAYRLNDYLWFNGYFTGVNIDEVSSGVDMVPITKAGVTTTYIVKAILAKDIPNDLVFTITFTLDDAQYTRRFTVNLATYDAGNDEALKQALLIYGEAAEDMFSNNTNKIPANVTKPADIPGATQMEDQHESVSIGSQASNVTVSRYGMTIGFGNCLQFIYGFRVNDAAGITDWSNIVEIGLLYSDVAGTLEAKKESFAYVLYQNPALVKDSENLPQGVVPTPKPTDTTLSQDELKSMWSTNNGIYMIAYNMAYEDYGKSYNYRPYILYADGSVAYGEQFAYSLTTYIGNRLNSTANAPSDTEKTLLYATWNLKEAVATWLSAKESAT